MTAGINSLPFAVAAQTACPTAGALPVQTPSSSADAEARRLATAVARGDEAAFRELYDRYHQRVLRFALVLGHGDEALAGDTVQSVFVTAAAKLRRVESEEHLWNWLARVTRQQITRSWRQQQRDSSVVSVTRLPELAETAATDSVLEEKLDAALLAMEMDDRQLIEKFYFDGLSHKEIAEQLGATPKAISSRLERARARLRSLLTHACP